MRNILFIGTSFLGAIKEGWESLKPSSYEAVFVGITAPDFVDALRQDWKSKSGKVIFPDSTDLFISTEIVNGNVLSYSKSKSSNHRSFAEVNKVNDLVIDLKAIDHVIFVDMFFRYGHVFEANECGFVKIKGTPVSRKVLSKIQLQGFNGWAKLFQNIKFGNIPFQDTTNFLNLFVDRDSERKVWLIAAPRAPQQNIDVVHKYGDIEKARQSMDFIEGFYQERLLKYGIEFIKQPAQVLDEHFVFTKNKFSRGDHNMSQEGKLDGHMDVDYGKILVENLLDRLNFNTP